MTQNDTHNGKLTAAQQKALPVIAATPNIADAARTAGIGRATLHRWMKQPVFAAAVQRERRAASDAALEGVRVHIGAAIETLRNLLGCESLAVRRGAARDLLDLSFKVCELQDITERLDELEGRLKAKG